MARPRDARFQSAEELAAALKGFLLAHNPGYNRSHLGRFLRRAFAREIEQELRLLEEYVVGRASGEVGVNLIADALGPRAPYTQFTPDQHADLSGPLTIATAPPRFEATEDIPTQVMERKRRR